MSNWQDMIVGDRMTVDNEFASRIESSRFSRQEWGLIMTAISFEIENPEDETDAELVADTSQLEAMMPEIENVANMGPMGAPGGGSDADGGGGLLGSIRKALGLGGNGSGGDTVDQGKLSDAEALVAEYVETLQAHLESEGRWDDVRAAAVDE